MPSQQLEYPFHKSWSPELGKPFAIQEDVFWLRMPLPYALNHINLWLLKDGDQWTIVDTGVDCDLCKQTWQEVLSCFVKPSEIKQIIITHYHPDHIGLAAWLAQQADCRVLISRGEFERYSEVNHRDPVEYEQSVAKYMSDSGFDEQYTKSYLDIMLGSEKDIYLQQEICDFIRHGDEIVINGSSWKVVVGSGHSPEHACLYNVDKKLFIAGDQALPRITSNVSVYLHNVDTDPLKEWLDSCERIKSSVDKNVRVLPAHQEPFYGVDIRMQQLVEGHQDDLLRLKEILSQPKTLKQACADFFARELNIMGRMMAMGETLAHINYLLNKGEVIKIKNEDAIHVYQTK